MKTKDDILKVIKEWYSDIADIRQKHDALENLQRVFPYGVRSKNGTFRSLFCTGKPHSMTHCPDNYATVGRIQIISTSVTETRMKTAVKTPSRQLPQEQHGGGGGDGAAAAPGRNRCAPSLHHLCMMIFWVCTMFDRGLLF
jgi:hypothetical protein